MRKKKETVMKKYKEFLEKTYDHSPLYRSLVYLSRIARMILYIVIGASIIAVVLSEREMATLENLVYWLTKTTIGKIIAIIFGICLIVYGIEKPRK